MQKEIIFGIFVKIFNVHIRRIPYDHIKPAVLENRRKLFLPVKTIHLDPVVIGKVKMSLGVKIRSYQAVAAFDVVFQRRQERHVGVPEKPPLGFPAFVFKQLEIQRKFCYLYRLTVNVNAKNGIGEDALFFAYKRS